MPWTIGNGGVGVRGEPEAHLNFRDLCAAYQHPGVTYNPLCDLTWCQCGARIYYGEHVPLGMWNPARKVICRDCKEPTTAALPAPHVAPACARCDMDTSAIGLPHPESEVSEAPDV